MLGVKKMPLRSVLLPWLLLRVMFPHYTQQCWDYRCVFLLALSLNLPLDTVKGIIQCSLCVIGLFYFHNSYFDSDSVLTRILPWGVPGPPLLRNRGPVRTSGGQSYKKHAVRRT